MSMLPFVLWMLGFPFLISLRKKWEADVYSGEVESKLDKARGYVHWAIYATVAGVVLWGSR
jgi:hypothetical protein